LTVGLIVAGVEGCGIGARHRGARAPKKAQIAVNGSRVLRPAKSATFARVESCARLSLMKLYYSPGACSLASNIVLHEAKLQSSFVKVDLKSKQTETGEDFRVINPKGYVPALEIEGGDLLTENIAILQYLASLKPELLPQSGAAKWHAIETLAFVSTELHKAFKPLFDPSSSEEVKQKAKDLVAQRLLLLVPRLAQRKFIVGDCFTVVDAYLFVMLTWARKQGVSVPPELQRYADALSERASVKEALELEAVAKAS
jgi:glutathione S-transferase